MGNSSNMHDKLIVALVALILTTSACGAGDFLSDFEPTFGDHRVKSHGGRLLGLSLDKFSGSGFRSKKDYLFGRVDMQMQLVPGDSSGTVTTFYLTSDQRTGRHDEIDFEFLGNVSGQPYTIHTNVFSQGKGDREQQFHLWFDPTKAFHTYTIVWNTRLIMFLIDNTPIRVFRSNEDIGVPFPKNQPMKIQCSLWSADWATQGGLIKTDWSKAPFTAYYRNYNIDACVGMNGRSACANSPGSWRTHDLDANSRRRLRWVQMNYMIYDYCKDSKRYPRGFPAECKRSS